MTNKDFKEGMEVTCELNGIKVWDAKLKKVSDNGWCIHATRNGLTQDWCIGDGIDLERHGVTNLQPKHRTIDDLECGDYVVGKYGKKLCLAICGKLYGMSYNNDFETLEGWFTLKNLIEMDYTLYQPTEVKEKTARERILELMRDSDQEWACDEIIKLKETDIDEVTLDRCIKVVEEYMEGSDIVPTKFMNDLGLSLVQALKNLKNKYETKNN